MNSIAFVFAFFSLAIIVTVACEPYVVELLTRDLTKKEKEEIGLKP